MPEILFECSICYETNDTMPAKYNCTECQQKTCDVCYIKHINTDNKCIFCRNPLIIDESDINNYTFFFIKYKKTTSWVIFIIITWNFLLLMYIFYTSEMKKTLVLTNNITKTY